MPKYSDFLQKIELCKNDILFQAKAYAKEQGDGFIYIFESEDLDDDNDKKTLRYCSFQEMKTLGIEVKTVAYDKNTQFLVVYIDGFSEKLYGPFVMSVVTLDDHHGDQKQKRDEKQHPLLSLQTLSTTKKTPFVCANPLCWQTDNLLKCGRCFISVYCSIDCQKAHWPEHIHECRFDRNVLL